MREQLQPAYVLHRRPFRDSSELVDVLTSTVGRQTLVARGLSRRRRGGALGALLQPFQPLLVSFSGRGEMPTLTGAEAAGTLPPLRGDELLGGLYLNELLLRLLPRYEVHGDLFIAYGSTIAKLAALAPGQGMEPSLRSFEFALLDELGYGVDLEYAADSGVPVHGQGLYRLVPQQGFFEHHGVGEGSDNTYAGASLVAIAGGNYAPPHDREAKRLIRELLDPHLGDKPLRSRAMFAAGRRTSPETFAQ